MLARSASCYYQSAQSIRRKNKALWISLRRLEDIKGNLHWYQRQWDGTHRSAIKQCHQVECQTSEFASGSEARTLAVSGKVWTSCRLHRLTCFSMWCRPGGPEACSFCRIDGFFSCAERAFVVGNHWLVHFSPPVRWGLLDFMSAFSSSTSSSSPPPSSPPSSSCCQPSTASRHVESSVSCRTATICAQCSREIECQKICQKECQKIQWGPTATKPEMLVFETPKTGLLQVSLRTHNHMLSTQLPRVQAYTHTERGSMDARHGFLQKEASFFTCCVQCRRNTARHTRQHSQCLDHDCACGTGIQTNILGTSLTWKPAMRFGARFENNVRCIIDMPTFMPPKPTRNGLGTKEPLPTMQKEGTRNA